MPPDVSDRISAIEEELTACFAQQGYSGYVRVHLSEQSDSVWFYIGHGTRVRREAAIHNETPTSIRYRPEVYDAVVFVRLTGELGIHARGSWEKQTYQRVFGKYLFGNALLFMGTTKYTLDPLLMDGQDALRCQDVPQIEWVKLGEIRWFDPGPYGRVSGTRSEDLFGSWASPKLPLSLDCHLIAAGFHIKLFGCSDPRWVMIRSGNRAQYARDVDPTWIEAWLRQRGFITGNENGNAQPNPLLAIA
jgi:hypothetical protein